MIGFVRDYSNHVGIWYDRIRKVKMMARLGGLPEDYKPGCSRIPTSTLIGSINYHEPPDHSDYLKGLRQVAVEDWVSAR